MSCRVAMLRMHRTRCRRHVGATPTAPCTAVAPRRRNRSCRSSPASMRCRRCRYDRSPISAKRSCGASTWTATTTSATPLPGARCATWSPASGACWNRRLWRQRLEGGPPRPLHRLERCPTRSPPAVGREQRPLPDLALGAGAQSRFHGAGSQQPPAARRWQARYGYRPLLLEPSCSPTASPVPAQLDPCRSDPRPGKSTAVALPRKDLALPEARLPPPTLRPSQSSPQPVERIFTWTCFLNGAFRPW